jgi:hypothetical protein
MPEFISKTEPCRMYWPDNNWYPVGRQHASKIKVTCLQARSSTGFSLILLCCELCQTVQVHRRYTDRLRLYRQGFDITECTAFQNYTQRQRLKLQLDWEMRYIVNLTKKPVSISEIYVFWCHLTPVSVREDSAVLEHGWHNVNEACWLDKNNVQVLYMHKSLPWRMLGQIFQRREIYNKLQLTECSWINGNEITRNKGEIFPTLAEGPSNKHILESESLS